MQIPENFYNYSRDTFKNKNVTITLYDDGRGYSLVGNYSDKVKLLMGVGKKGIQVPFFSFYFSNNSIQIEDYLPILISVNLTAAVKENSKTRYMLNDSSVKFFKPIDITSKDDFFVSLKNGKTYERSWGQFKEVPLINIYDRILRVHISDISTPRGFYSRLKILIVRKIPSWIFYGLSWALGWIVWIIKGKRYVFDVVTKKYLKQDKYISGYKDRTKSTEIITDDIDFFGYKVGIWTLYTYSMLVVLISILFPKYLIAVLPQQNPADGIFTVALAIVTIITYDKILPFLITRIVNYSAEKSFDLKYKGVRFNI